MVRVKISNGDILSVTLIDNQNNQEKYKLFIESFENELKRKGLFENIDDENVTEHVFVCKGKIITSSDTFSTVNNGDILMYMPRKVKRTAIQVVNNEIEPTTTPSEPTYNYKQVKASFIVLLNFVQNNRQLKELYNNDFDQLMSEFMHNEDLDKMVKTIVNQSKEIERAMSTGTNIRIDVKGTMGELDLSPEDQECINEIIDAGFPADVAIRTYIENGKDLESAMSALLNN